MRVLLDTNILIHREASKTIRSDIGKLFFWLDKLQYEKCYHPLTLDEIRKHRDPSVVKTMETKLQNYHLLKTTAPESASILAIRERFDTNDNDSIDTSLLKEVFAGRIDLLLSEDKKVHDKAEQLNISHKVFLIEQFLEKVVIENPDFTDYEVLSVKRAYFGDLNINDEFFASFKEDYIGFEDWFIKKSDEVAYVCFGDQEELVAFLYLKVENKDENYSDIKPIFDKKHRLKIGTFKVISNGYKLGERFLKIIFDNAVRNKVDEIYVTIFNKNPDQNRLTELILNWGFVHHGEKSTTSGTEQVYLRDFKLEFNKENPASSYPFISKSQRKFIVPIYPEYHTELLPDSLLKTENPENYIDNKPNRNAISKVYVSRSIRRDLQTGDIIVFYRTKDRGHGHHTSVATTIGVVQELIDNIPNLDEFIRLCRKRSVFSDEQLKKQWDYNPRSRPFIVNFLFIYSFPKRLNLSRLKALNIIEDAPRGFELLTDVAFDTLMENSNVKRRFVVN